MKVGTDGVLLGIFASAENAQKVLDIGTGSGLIALLIAQRSQALITAIDIDADSIQQATENFKNSPWQDRISAKLSSLQALATNCQKEFDLIVSNPPFFSTGLKPIDKRRVQSKHTDFLSHQDLIVDAAKLLSDSGNLEIILPSSESHRFIHLAELEGIHLNRILHVIPVEGKDASRSLMTFSKIDKELICSNLCIQKISGGFTEEFIDFGKDYYLSF